MSHKRNNVLYIYTYTHIYINTYHTYTYMCVYVFVYIYLYLRRITDPFAQFPPLVVHCLPISHNIVTRTLTLTLL